MQEMSCLCLIFLYLVHYTAQPCFLVQAVSQKLKEINYGLVVGVNKIFIQVQVSVEVHICLMHMK